MHAIPVLVSPLVPYLAGHMLWRLQRRQAKSVLMCRGSVRDKHRRIHAARYGGLALCISVCRYSEVSLVSIFGPLRRAVHRFSSWFVQM